MAVTTTALGFKKPDGQELVKGGDNVIADNAQTAQDLIAADRGRLGAIEALNVTQNGRLSAAEGAITTTATLFGTTNTRIAAVESANTAQDIRLSSVESAAFVGGGLLMEDPADPGFYLVGGTP